MRSNLCVYRSKMVAAPRLSRKSFALELGAHVFNLCKAIQVRKSSISIEVKKMVNKVKVVLVADLSVHCETFIINFFQLTTGYDENRDVFVKSQTISMLSRIYLNKQPSSHQGNQILFTYFFYLFIYLRPRTYYTRQEKDII